ncbi:MAG: diguanylate cyclase [Treponema sp.]|nr:diguanylate cyclase [Treponema sp.]
MLLIPKKSSDEALDIVKQILHETRTTIDIEENRCITVSAGFITCSGSMNFEQTMEEVDKKLYLAKKAGKDRVIS